jgi:hypothetical protein
MPFATVCNFGRSNASCHVWTLDALLQSNFLKDIKYSYHSLIGRVKLHSLFFFMLADFYL